MKKKSKSLYCYLTKDRPEYLKVSLEAYDKAGIGQVDALLLDGKSTGEAVKLLRQYESLFRYKKTFTQREVIYPAGVTYDGTAYECAIRFAYKFAEEHGYDYFTIVESDSIPNEPEIFQVNEQLIQHLENKYDGDLDVLSMYSTFFANATPMSTQLNMDLGVYTLMKKRSTFWGNCFITFRTQAYNEISVYARSTNDALDVTIGKPEVCQRYSVFNMFPSLVAHIGVETAQKQDVPFHQALQIYDKGIVRDFEDRITIYPEYAPPKLKEIFFSSS